MIAYTALADINGRINGLPYTAGVDRLWEPIDADNDGGTCSNYAVAKYRALRALGVPRESLILSCAFVEPHQIKDPDTGAWRNATKAERYHAILIVQVAGRQYVMDNRAQLPVEIDFCDYEWHKLWNWSMSEWEWAKNADRSIA